MWLNGYYWFVIIDPRVEISERACVINHPLVPEYHSSFVCPPHTIPYHPILAHRASLMYGFASAQLAGIALLSSYSERTNVWATIATQSFFVQAVLMYAAHGLLRDTTNQLKPPHRVGEKHAIPPWMVKGFMWSLIAAEVGGCGVLIAGMVKTFLDVLPRA